ncbi:hypothetical protein [Alloactinosynnema sp. L-07]|nr:hypothetical protein [Alloactinosynnema sp. L-07]
MRKRTPTRQAPGSYDVLANGTWLEELPEDHQVVDRPLVVTKESGLQVVAADD